MVLGEVDSRVREKGFIKKFFLRKGNEDEGKKQQFQNYINWKLVFIWEVVLSFEIKLDSYYIFG